MSPLYYTIFATLLLTVVVFFCPDFQKLTATFLHSFQVTSFSLCMVGIFTTIFLLVSLYLQFLISYLPFLPFSILHVCSFLSSQDNFHLSLFHHASFYFSFSCFRFRTANSFLLFPRLRHANFSLPFITHNFFFPPLSYENSLLPSPIVFHSSLSFFYSILSLHKFLPSRLPLPSVLPYES